MSQLTRRRFLAAAGAAGGMVCSSLVAPAPAVEPVQRTGTPKFKFSLAGYSYRKLLTGNPPAMTLDDFFMDCARMGLEGTEPTSYYFPKPVTREYLCHLKHLAFRLGLDISGTAIGNDFCHPPGPQRDAQLQLAREWIEHAAFLGAPVIRIFSGRQREGQTAAEAHRLAVEAIEEACEYAGRYGVFLALENHGGLTATVEGMLKLVHDVKSTWFGVNLDTGNFHSEDIYGDLAQLAPYALNVQVKVVVSGPQGGREPADFKRLADILRKSGYRGYIVLEYEEAEDPREACPRYIAQLREAFA